MVVRSAPHLIFVVFHEKCLRAFDPTHMENYHAKYLGFEEDIKFIVPTALTVLNLQKPFLNHSLFKSILLKGPIWDGRKMVHALCTLSWRPMSINYPHSGRFSTTRRCNEFICSPFVPSSRHSCNTILYTLSDSKPNALLASIGRQMITILIDHEAS